MPNPQPHIIHQLQREILHLQGYKKPLDSSATDVGLGAIKNAFSGATFPLGVIHEFVCPEAEDGAATRGFISGILSGLMQNEGVCLWISTMRTLFPPALQAFGIAPENLIFIDLQKEQDVIWAVEEALKCSDLSAVVGEMRELDFTASRRLQLAVEQSSVTGFILRHNHRKQHTTACVSRWKITSIPSASADGLPGVGFPRWNVELLKVRNGKPGSWQVEWAEGRFQHIENVNFPKVHPVIEEAQKKTA